MRIPLFIRVPLPTILESLPYKYRYPIQMIICDNTNPFVPVSSRRMMSSLKLVPPVVAMTLTPPRCLATWMLIWLTCKANSLVGTITMAGGGGNGNHIKALLEINDLYC